MNELLFPGLYIADTATRVWFFRACFGRDTIVWYWRTCLLQPAQSMAGALRLLRWNAHRLSSGYPLYGNSCTLPMDGCISSRPVQGQNTWKNDRRIHVLFICTQRSVAYITKRETDTFFLCRWYSQGTSSWYGLLQMYYSDTTYHPFVGLYHPFLRAAVHCPWIEQWTLIRQYEKLVKQYIGEGRLAQESLTSAYCAEQLHLSEAYFNDLLELQLGHTHNCHIQLQRIEIAKEKLRSSEESLSQIVYELGFPSVQYFGFLFKKITGISPNEYNYWIDL